MRGAIGSLPPRERRVIALYYYGEVTMKEIGAELGVNESRVSQLHARALRRLREALGPDATPMASMEALRQAVVAFEHRPKMAKATLPQSDTVVAPEWPTTFFSASATTVSSCSVTRSGTSSNEPWCSTLAWIPE